MPLTFPDRARLMRSYLRGDTRTVPGPLEINVETTVRCNLLCPMCPRTGAGYPNADLPDDLLYGALDQAAALGTDSVLLFGLGEPFMDRRIFDILRYCRERRLGTTISTNGTFLDAERRVRLLEAGCDHLVISIDGVTEATYQHYRTGGKFDRVVSYARALAEDKWSRGSAMTLTLQFIRMRLNLHEEDAFVRYWRAVRGVDQVRIKEEDVGLPEHAMYDGDGRQRANPCHILWRGPFCIRWTGDVYPCSRMATAGAPPLGNLRTASLEELWNSAAMRQLRGLHADGRHMEEPLCVECHCARPRLPLVLGGMALPGTTLRRLIPAAERIGRRVPRLISERRTTK